MKDAFKNMGEFSVEIMPAATTLNHLLKLKYEADEVINDPDDIVEYADCLLCIFAAAYKAGFSFEELEKACNEKIKILKTRKWGHIDGLYQHIKEEK